MEMGKFKTLSIDQVEYNACISGISKAVDNINLNVSDEVKGVNKDEGRTGYKMVSLAFYNYRNDLNSIAVMLRSYQSILQQDIDDMKKYLQNLLLLDANMSRRIYSGNQISGTHNNTLDAGINIKKK